MTRSVTLRLGAFAGKSSFVLFVTFVVISQIGASFCAGRLLSAIHVCLNPKALKMTM